MSAGEAEDPAIDPRAVELADCNRSRRNCDHSEPSSNIAWQREQDDNLYAALSRQYQSAQTQLAEIEVAIRRREEAQNARSIGSPETRVDAALALLDDVAQISTDPEARARINPLLIRLGLWIGLMFRPTIKGTKRVVQQLVSGRIVFGDGPLPVPLFGKDNVGDQPHGGGCTSSSHVNERAENKQIPCAGESAGESERENAEENNRGKKHTAGKGMVPIPAGVQGDQTPDRLISSQPEGISITKDSRGDWIRTSDLLNPIWPLGFHVRTCKSMT